MKITGVSLHLYDSKNNHDKYYRIFYFEFRGDWAVVQHWGRDGTAGQFRETWYTSEQQADEALTAHCRRQTKKGYTLLGNGALNRGGRIKGFGDLREVSESLHDWIAKPVLKVPDGWGFVIQEEEDITDVINQCSETSPPPPPLLTTA